jgi:hypothetical protein
VCISRTLFRTVVHSAVLGVGLAVNSAVLFDKVGLACELCKVHLRCLARVLVCLCLMDLSNMLCIEFMHGNTGLVLELMHMGLVRCRFAECRVLHGLGSLEYRVLY